MSGPHTGIEVRFQVHYPGAEQGALALDVDVTLPGTGTTAIFGPSGSGKTTLLRCMAGLQASTGGHFAVNGQTWQSATMRMPTHQRPVGYVFQESSLFPHLTAHGNLRYAMRRAPAPASDDLYRQVLDTLDLKPLLTRRPAQLSGGERQRVAIARALLIQPRLLLMDEPLASLDSARKREILPYLERLRSSFDLPCFYVSHDMDEVARLADYAVVLERGTVAAVGSLSEVFSRIDLTARAEQDTSVVLHGRVVERDEDFHLSRIALTGGAQLWVRDSGDMPGESVRIRVMARDISLALTPQDDSSILNRIQVTVAELGPDLDEAMSLVRCQAGSDFIVARITRRSVAHLALAPGRVLWAQVKSAAVLR